MRYTRVRMGGIARKAIVAIAAALSFAQGALASVEDLYRSLFPAPEYAVDRCQRGLAQFAAGRYGPEQQRALSALGINGERYLLQSMREGLGPFRKLLGEYERELTGPVLEIGPLYQPLVEPGRRGGGHTYYWDMDVEALMRHADDGTGRPRDGVTASYIDLNTTDTAFLDAFRRRTRDQLAREAHGSFRAVVVSQVLNYVEPARFFRLVGEFQAPGDMIFINNPLNAGDGAFLHPNRPRTHQALLDAVTTAGYDVVRTERQSGPDGDYIQIVARRRAPPR